MPRLKLNPTAIGTFAVVVWGMSLPLNRFIASQIGMPALIGTVFTVTGMLGLLTRRLRNVPFPDRAVFRNPLVYLRWLCFVLNPVGVWTAALIVNKPHLPVVVLINYLWPTGIILLSVLIAGVRITRPALFVTGTLVVIASLSIEILQPDTLGRGLFVDPVDRLAYCLAFISAFSWATYTALTRRAGKETGGAALIPLFQLTLGLALPLSLLPDFNEWDQLTTGMGLILATWCCLQFCAFLTWDYGTRQGNVVILSLCADFIPWLSLAASHILIGVDIPPRTILSALCLVAGAMITRYGTMARRDRREQAEELAIEHTAGD